VQEALLVVTRISPVPPELEGLGSVGWAVAVQAPEPVCVTVAVCGVDSEVKGEIVIAVLRCEKLKGGAETGSVSEPGLFRYGGRPPMESQGAPTLTIQLQTDGTTTLRFCASPDEFKCSEEGVTTGYSQDPPA
jgi:hypothetical protein